MVSELIKNLKIMSARNIVSHPKSTTGCLPSQLILSVVQEKKPKLLGNMYSFQCASKVRRIGSVRKD